MQLKQTKLKVSWINNLLNRCRKVIRGFVC